MDYTRVNSTKIFVWGIFENYGTIPDVVETGKMAMAGPNRLQEDITILFWNIRKKIWHKIPKISGRLNTVTTAYDVIAFVEAYKRPGDTSVPGMVGYHLVYHQNAEYAMKGGIAVFVRKDFQGFVQPISSSEDDPTGDAVKGMLKWFRAGVGSIHLYLCVVYCPQISSAKKSYWNHEKVTKHGGESPACREKMLFTDKIASSVREYTRTGNMVILMGDFNSSIGNFQNRRSLDGEKSLSQDRIQDLVTEADMYILNGRSCISGTPGGEEWNRHLIDVEATVYTPKRKQKDRASPAVKMKGASSVVKTEGASPVVKTEKATPTERNESTLECEEVPSEPQTTTTVRDYALVNQQFRNCVSHFKVGGFDKRFEIYSGDGDGISDHRSLCVTVSKSLLVSQIKGDLKRAQKARNDREMKELLEAVRELQMRPIREESILQEDSRPNTSTEGNKRCRRRLALENQKKESKESHEDSSEEESDELGLERDIEKLRIS